MNLLNKKTHPFTRHDLFEIFGIIFFFKNEHKPALSPPLSSFLEYSNVAQGLSYVDCSTVWQSIIYKTTKNMNMNRTVFFWSAPSFFLSKFVPSCTKNCSKVLVFYHLYLRRKLKKKNFEICSRLF